MRWFLLFYWLIICIVRFDLFPSQFPLQDVLSLRSFRVLLTPLTYIPVGEAHRS